MVTVKEQPRSHFEHSNGRKKIKFKNSNDSISDLAVVNVVDFTSDNFWCSSHGAYICDRHL